MKRRTPASYHHGDLKNELIRAGIEILAKEGVNGLTLREVAKRAKVSHAAPYRHFADREALIAAIAQQGFSGLSDAMENGISRYPGDPLAQLTEAGWTYVHHAIQHPEHVKVMFGGLITDQERYADLTHSAECFKKLVSVVESGQRAGSVKKGDSRRIALALFSGVHGLAMLIINRQLRTLGFRNEDPKSLSKEFTQILLEGAMGTQDAS